MSSCSDISKCTFIKEYSTNQDMRPIVDISVRMYCTGDKQEQCKRKMVSKALGGPSKVPSNMTPTGSPLNGTGTAGWSKEVLKIIKG